MIKRKIEKVLKKYLKQYPVLVLTGPRQSGKTTLLKSIFPKFEYVNLEDLELREYALSDPKGFLNNYGEKVIFDEIQRVPELFSYIQVLVDEKKKNGLYILSGSQNFLLMEKINQSLAGRAAIFKLLPFSKEEIKNEIKNIKVQDVLFRGFYPKVYNEKIFKAKDIEQYYLNYIQTYIERDVRLIRNISDLRQFQRFLTLLAGRVGQILNMKSLAEDCGINVKTAND
jgi:predicted AAA+ superfamily ATPase